MRAASADISANTVVAYGRRRDTVMVVEPSFTPRRDCIVTLGGECDCIVSPASGRCPQFAR
jgi:hypothetical protein